MKLYNTLGRAIQELEPLKPPKLSFYTCGPTVYLDPHIGNWRTFIFYDTLERTLMMAGLQPQRVMNITDVGHLTSDEDEGDKDAGEDKLQITAQKQRISAWEVAQNYTQKFLDGMKKLNLLEPHYLPKATDHIKEQIDLIKALEQKGYTYQIDDGIYFDTSKLDDYGKLLGAKLDDQQAMARVEVNPQKRHPRDFALWKLSPKGQKRDMEWASPWGNGFPGWHLECSAMAIKYLGESLDIHGGGVDHIGTHHTNEIAQSEAATGKPFAQVWAHAEFLTVEGAKMAKSAGNYHTLEDIIKKGFDPLAFRLLVLQSHYRSQLNFRWTSLAAATSFLQKLRAFADRRFQAAAGAADKTMSQLIADVNDQVLAAMTNDLDSPAAIASLSKLLSYVEAKALPKANLSKFQELLSGLDNAFGLKLGERSDITLQLKQLIDRREAARIAKDFAKADEIRQQLAKQGIGLNDNDFGITWYRLRD